MKLMKGLLSAFAVVLATTACAGNSGENKKSNESTKEDNKMEVQGKFMPRIVRMNKE